MKTKSQKREQIKTTSESLDKSQVLLISDFSGLSVNAMNKLRQILKDAGMYFSVVKKRLLQKAFNEKGIEIDSKKLSGQTGVIFSSKDILETCQLVYGFQKEHKDKFKMLAGVEMSPINILEGAKVEQIGKLPKKEVILGQFVGMLTVPMRQFMCVLNEKIKMSLKEN